MTKEEFIKGMEVLGTAFDREYTPKDCDTYYEFLKSYSYETFKTAVKNIITKSKFVPKISELIEECESCKVQIKYDVLEFMKAKGYFKIGEYGELSSEQETRNYEKTIMWMERGNVPAWLQEVINNYYKMMKQELLASTSQSRIGQVLLE